MRLLKEMQEQLGISVVVSKHDIDIVPLYCDLPMLWIMGNYFRGYNKRDLFTGREIA